MATASSYLMTACSVGDRSLVQELKEVVVQLLASDVQDGLELMSAIFKALYNAIEYDRLNVVKAVLDY
ncbi:hypothetical protein HK405_002949, partial [Cladochytrium tenue]